MKYRNLSITFMILMIVSLIATFVFFGLLLTSEQNLKEEEQKNIDLIAKLRNSNDSLDIVSLELAAERDRLKKLKDSITLLFPQEVSAIEESIENAVADIKVGLNYNINNNNITSAQNWLSANGYEVYYSKVSNVAGSYVIYYNPDLAELAEQLAGSLKSATGITFQPTLGRNPSSLTAADSNKTFIIHIKQ